MRLADAPRQRNRPHRHLHRHVPHPLEANRHPRRQPCCPITACSRIRAGEVFKILCEDCDLHTVLRLPRGTFTPYSPEKYEVRYTEATNDARPLRITVDRGTAFFSV